MQTLRDWKEKTKTQRNEHMRAKNQAVQDLHKFGYDFDFFKPCSSSFDPEKGGWTKSKTTFNLMTRSVEAMYTFKLWKGRTVRVIRLTTGHYYYLMTFKNQYHGINS